MNILIIIFYLLIVKYKLIFKFNNLKILKI